MIVIGLVLLLCGYLLGVGMLVTVGWVLVLVGLILLAVSYMPSGPLNGRRYW